MRRNWDTVLSVLTKVEELSDRVQFHALYPEHVANGRVASTPDATEIVSHLRLLIRSGFIEGTDFPSCVVVGLTWSGHDLIEALRAKQPQDS